MKDNKMEKTLKEFLTEKKLISRWMIFVAAMNDVFAGMLLMFIMALLGIIG